MNKSELIERLAQKLGLGTVQAEEIVRILIDQMRGALSSGKRIEIRGFGSFVVKDYRSYWGRNPKTGDKIRIKAKKLPAFKVGKELKERLNGSSAGTA